MARSRNKRPAIFYIRLAVIILPRFWMYCLMSNIKEKRLIACISDEIYSSIGKDISHVAFYSMYPARFVYIRINRLAMTAIA